MQTLMYANQKVAENVPSADHLQTNPSADRGTPASALLSAALFTPLPYDITAQAVAFSQIITLFSILCNYFPFYNL